MLSTDDGLLVTDHLDVVDQQDDGLLVN